MQTIEFLIPGNINALTGGYTYDREVAAALNASGTEVTIRALDEDLTQADARERAGRLIAELPDGALTLIDGLALAPLAQLLAAEADRLRLVGLVHHPAALETGLSPSQAATIAQQERSALMLMQHVICTSGWTSRELLRLGLSEEQVFVVEPGVDSALLNALAPTRRRDPALAHAHGLRLICVATLTPRKGHAALINALAQLTDLDWQLECIGSRDRDPACAYEVVSLVERHGLGNRIHFVDELSREPLAERYAFADLFVLASRLEGYGMVFAEAMAAGLPIVATSGGAIADTLANGSAIVVDGESDNALAQSLRELMTNRRGWLKIAAAAREQSFEVRSWQQVAGEFADALTTALKN